MHGRRLDSRTGVRLRAEYEEVGDRRTREERDESATHQHSLFHSCPRSVQWPAAGAVGAEAVEPPPGYSSTMSARRFVARPSGVSLEPTGWNSAKPAANARLGFTPPCSVR